MSLVTSGAVGTFATPDAGIGVTVNVSGLTLTGADAGKYTLVEPTTTANITPKLLTTTGITAENKIYDGTTAATLNTSSASLVGVIPGDTVTLNTMRRNWYIRDEGRGDGDHRDRERLVARGSRRGELRDL